MQLKRIYTPIKEDLAAVEKTIRDSAKADEKFVDRIANYLFSSSGKLIRPALVLLSAQIGGENRSKAINLAAAVEFIHTATLVQDDVVDKAELRRGKITVGRKWGENISILFGDYLYSKAFGILSKFKDERVLSSLAGVTTAMAAGEIEQLHLVGKKISEQKYFEIIRKKTADLFSACCETGAMVGGASPKKIRALTNFGLNFGMAFQIVDDCLDRSEPGKVKKSVGLDQKMGKITLPVIYNSADQAISKAAEYLAQAKQSLADVLPTAPAKTLAKLGDYVLSRAG